MAPYVCRDSVFCRNHMAYMSAFQKGFVDKTLPHAKIAYKVACRSWFAYHAKRGCGYDSPAVDGRPFADRRHSRQVRTRVPAAGNNPHSQTREFLWIRAIEGYYIERVPSVCGLKGVQGVGTDPRKPSRFFALHARNDGCTWL